MYNTHRFVTAGILITAIAASTPTLAAQVGRVLFTSGEVRIVAVDGSTRLAKRGDFVQSGERLQTAAGALGQVQMNDGARVAVRSDSRLRFDAPPANAKAVQMSLEGGNVRVLNIAAKGEAAIPPVEIKTTDGDVLMQQADAVVAKNVRKTGGASGEQSVVVRVDQGTGQLSTASGTGTKTTALTTSNAVAINAGKIEPFTGDLRGNNALTATSATTQRSSDKTLANVTPLKPPTVSSLPPAIGNPSSAQSPIQRPLVTLPASPLRPVSTLVPSPQLPVAFADRSPDIVIRNIQPGQQTDLAPALSALGSIVRGKTFRPGLAGQTLGATAPTATVTGGRTTISGAPKIDGRSVTPSTQTSAGALSVTLLPRLSTTPTLLRR